MEEVSRLFVELQQELDRLKKRTSEADKEYRRRLKEDPIRYAKVLAQTRERQRRFYQRKRANAAALESAKEISGDKLSQDGAKAADR